MYRGSRQDYIFAQGSVYGFMILCNQNVNAICVSSKVMQKEALSGPNFQSSVCCSLIPLRTILINQVETNETKICSLRLIEQLFPLQQSHTFLTPRRYTNSTLFPQPVLILPLECGNRSWTKLSEAEDEKEKKALLVM